jgi:small subunit ribosomal protein S20
MYIHTARTLAFPRQYGIFSTQTTNIMPITSSAKKAERVSERKRVFNLRRSRDMKETIKEVGKAITAGKLEEATKLLPKAYQAIDKAAKRGVIKDNNASRKKSRLSRTIARAGEKK